MAKANAPTDRRSLCIELLELFRKHDPIFKRVDAIKAELKKLAADAGENFKEEIVAQGSVSVSRPKKGEFKGSFPVLQPAAWLDAKPAAREKLIEKGLVKIEDQWGGDYYGAVTVKLV